MVGENPQHKHWRRALLRLWAGNGPPETRRYRGRVRINRIRIQVEPRTVLFALSPNQAQGVFYYLSQNQTKKEILT